MVMNITFSLHYNVRITRRHAGKYPSCIYAPKVK